MGPPNIRSTTCPNGPILIGAASCLLISFLDDLNCEVEPTLAPIVAVADMPKIYVDTPPWSTPSPTCQSRLRFQLTCLSGMLSGAGYPSGMKYPPGTGMEVFSYPCAGMGNPTGKFSPGGYGYG